MSKRTKKLTRRDMLKLVGAGAGATLLEPVVGATGRVLAQNSTARVPVTIERSPLRTIKDPYPSFSAVAVNSEANMLVVTDQNLFQILEYDSRTNTPPTARFTEPKRIISGVNTKAEMMCGVYIDPKTRDIYVINNDTQQYLPVFSTDSRGNAKPDRLLGGLRGFAITAHEERNELFITNQSGYVNVYRKQAEGNEKPLRTLIGNDTQLADPHGIAIDPKNNVFFVSNYGNGEVTAGQPAGETEGEGGRRGGRARSYGKFVPPSIQVYALEASGNTKPLRTIQGPKTLLNWPSHMALHVERQELFVANDADDSVLVFRTTDQGDTAPIRIIKGPKTGIKYPPGIALDERLNELFVASMGNASVKVFPVTANGDVPPVRTIRGGPEGRSALNIGNPGGVGYDTKRDQILVLNCVAHPQVAMFDRLSNGGEVPKRAIYGQPSKLSRSVHDIRYVEKYDEFVVANNLAGAIMTFAGGADGQASPIRVIQGPNSPGSANRLDVDSVHDEIFVPDGNRIRVYPRLANGDVAPIRIIEGPDTELKNAQSVAIDPINDVLVIGLNKQGNDPDAALLIFHRTDQGNAKPRVIRGPKSGIIRINQMTVYPARKLIIATMPGIIDQMEPEKSFLGIWSYEDSGDIPPRWLIPIGPRTTLKKVFGVALNPKHKEVIVADMRQQAILTFSLPEIF